MQLNYERFYQILVPRYQFFLIKTCFYRCINSNKNNYSPFPVCLSAAVTITTFHTQPNPQHTSSISAVTMQMLCSERFMLPSPGHHSQLPEPLS